MSKVVVVLSGGMDSATLLAQVCDESLANSLGTSVFPGLGRVEEVAAITVDYGQRHSCECFAARLLCQHYRVEHTVVRLPGLSAVMKGSSQTDLAVPVPEGHYESETMKQTVVPNRNMLLIATATAHAISLKYDVVAYGAHAGDHAIYPDCRKDFVTAIRAVMATCDYHPIELYAPFLDMDKGDIAVRGSRLQVPYELTWTCYNGRAKHCGKCGACQERLEAFAKAGRTDPVEYE